MLLSNPLSHNKLWMKFQTLAHSLLYKRPRNLGCHYWLEFHNESPLEEDVPCVQTDGI
jgi:hypothetical protein